MLQKCKRKMSQRRYDIVSGKKRTNESVPMKFPGRVKAGMVLPFMRCNIVSMRMLEFRACMLQADGPFLRIQPTGTKLNVGLYSAASWKFAMWYHRRSYNFGYLSIVGSMLRQNQYGQSAWTGPKHKIQGLSIVCITIIKAPFLLEHADLTWYGKGCPW